MIVLLLLPKVLLGKTSLVELVLKLFGEGRSRAVPAHWASFSANEVISLLGRSLTVSIRFGAGGSDNPIATRLHAIHSIEEF